MFVWSENMIFANPCKGKSHIAFAKQMQVPMMTFDNPDEVDKIMSIYPQVSFRFVLFLIVEFVS